MTRLLWTRAASGDDSEWLSTDRAWRIYRKAWSSPRGRFVRWVVIHRGDQVHEALTLTSAKRRAQLLATSIEAARAAKETNNV